MASQIGWIDFSPKHRERVRKFMDLMGMGGVVDELGVGMIRDAMSNNLFPGFSTLFTRAKYFFITPYILLDKATKQKRNQTGREYFNLAEKETNIIIKRFYISNPDRVNESYFGKEKDNGELKRQPSDIYWNGMQYFHLIEADGSLDQILLGKRSLMEELLSNSTKGDDGTTKEQGENKERTCENVSYDTNWQSEIKTNGLTLTRTEAETLRDRVTKYAPNSLTAALVNSDELWELYRSANKKSKETGLIDNAFVHFVDVAISRITNNELKRNLIAAHDLSIFLYGIHIAYNIRLWSKTSEYSFVDEMRLEGQKWFDELLRHMLDYENFDIARCMEGNVKPVTRKFLIEVQNSIKRASSWNEIEPDLCDFAEAQERWNKKAKSRFVKLEKEQVVDDMNKPQWLGLGLINYRYVSTLSIVSDIYDGLNQMEE